MNLKKPHPLFDALIKENELKNDAALCRELEVQAPTLSKIRSGTLPMNDTLRVAVMRKFKWSLNRMDEVVPPVVL